MFALGRPRGIHRRPACRPQERIARCDACRNLLVLLVDVGDAAKYSLKWSRRHVGAVLEYRRLVQCIVRPRYRNVAEGEVLYQLADIAVDIALIHTAQERLLRVERSNYRARGSDLTAVSEFHACAFAVSHDELVDRGTGHDRAAVGFYIALHRCREHLAATLGNRLTVVVNTRDHDVETLRRAQLVGQCLRRCRPTEDERLHVRVFEILKRECP